MVILYSLKQKYRKYEIKLVTKLGLVEAAPLELLLVVEKLV